MSKKIVFIKDVLFLIKTMFTIWFIKDLKKLKRRLIFIQDGCHEDSIHKFPTKQIVSLYVTQISNLILSKHF